jgi:hypothetical protein
MNRLSTYPLFLLLSACGSGTWTVNTWGEDYIEETIPADIFEDGCSVTYDRFEVALSDVALLDGDGEEVGTIDGEHIFDLTEVGPQEVGSVDVPATHYANSRFSISPSDALDGQSVVTAGTLECGGAAVTFDWTFATDTTYACAPADLTIPKGGEDDTQYTIHGDHLFYDGLENPDAVVRGLAIFESDADGDGKVTMAELDAVSVAPLGYEVGQYSAVTTLGDFVAFLTQTLGHVDGEGHCQVDL